MTGPAAALERLRVGLADRGLPVPDSGDPADTMTAALAAIDRLRGPLARMNPAAVAINWQQPAPERVIVPVPYDPRAGRMLA